MFQRAKPYTLEEKARLMAEVERRYRQGGRSYRDIARELGISDSSYHNWVRAGIKPAVLPEPTPAKRAAVPRPYASDERERLIADIERLRREGQSIVAACRTVGISDKSYRKWIEKANPLPAMRPVEVTALVPVASAAMTIAAPKPSPIETLTLVAPGGYRVEGLDVQGAAALLRALA